MPVEPVTPAIDFERDLADAERAAVARPDDPGAALRLAECRLYCGQVAQALEGVRALESLTWSQPEWLLRVAEFHVHGGQHEAAWRCHERVLALCPDDPDAHYAAASSCVALGRMDQADQLYQRVIALRPDDYDAWQNRSTLRRQTPEANHVEQMRYVLGHLDADDDGQVPVNYALGKELEDLGEYDAAFGHYQAGAEARRRRLSYDVATDESVMHRITTTFDADWVKQASEGSDVPGPVFVMGLPRTGTTLVERMLSAHPDVASLGETNTLLYALVHAAGPHDNREQLFSRIPGIDLPALGERYRTATRGYGHDAPLLVDKAPLNILYLGLILKAMPGARVIHLRRHPLDACFAMYKTLFRMGYPFSYRFQDVGRYYLAYHRLMAHWRAVLPGRFLDVDYEALVTDTEPQLRRLLDGAGLDWDPGCMDFHRQATPTATASAAQVRRPVYSDSVGRWRRYERQLAPLAAKLRQEGVDC
ncbi:tetratricopeptide repeat-containing sulfotransferase family protein [Marinihelvus fidelis]|nr:sulfotransferase [Marinihelvus fidelis]